MTLRSLSALLSVGAAVVAMATLAPPAQAADGVSCPITGTSPQVVTLGITSQSVRFGVRTTCDGVRPVNWQLSSDIYPGSSGASWLLLRNYDHPGGEKFTYVEDPEGDFIVNFIGAGPFQGNDMVGVHPLRAGAFYDADADGLVDTDEPVTFYDGSFVAKRGTTFGDSFTATQTGRRGHRRIQFDASLQLADWDTGQYNNQAAWVELQFRPAGKHHYRTVKRVWDDGESATTSVPATRTGTWRYHYCGDDVSGASNSAGITVVVHRSSR